MHGMNNAPTAERLLRLLADLYADQCGVKVTVEIVEMQRRKRDGKSNAAGVC